MFAKLSQQQSRDQVAAEEEENGHPRPPGTICPRPMWDTTTKSTETARNPSKQAMAPSCAVEALARLTGALETAGLVISGCPINITPVVRQATNAKQVLALLEARSQAPASGNRG
jgi:hypothetical protein